MKRVDFHAIGQKIKACRQNRGFTQEYVANRLDVNPSHISNIECGHVKPSLTLLVEIANVLQCSVDNFISGEYTFKNDENADDLDALIMDKVKSFHSTKKQKVLQIIDLL